MSDELGLLRGWSRLCIRSLLGVTLFCQACGNISSPVVGKAGETSLPDVDGLEVIAAVDSEAITVREFRQEMDHHRAGVFTGFNRRYSLDSFRDFWNHAFDGKTPLEVLKEKALESACRHKMQQILMKEKGLVEDIGYEAFLRQWSAENNARAEAAGAGKVLYGPVQYTERGYFQYLLTNGVIRLKSALAGHELSFTEEDLKHHFRKIKAERYGDKARSFEEHRRDIQDSYLDSLYDDYLEKRLAESTITINNEIYENDEQDSRYR